MPAFERPLKERLGPFLPTPNGRIRSESVLEENELAARLQSGKAMARTGLRMMPTFPSPPLKFRTAGFPRYGFKAGISDEAFPMHWFAFVLRALSAFIGVPCSV